MSSFPWRTLLFLSLAFNLLLIGGAVGAYTAGVRVQREAPAVVGAAIPAGPGAFMLALPPDVRAEVRAALEDTWAETRAEREAARDARQAVLDAARAEPFDAAAMNVALGAMRAADAVVAQRYHEAVTETFGALTPEARRAATEALAQPRPRLRQEMRERVRERWRERMEGEGTTPAPGAAPATGEERFGERFREKMREKREERRLARERAQQERAQQNGAPPQDSAP